MLLIDIIRGVWGGVYPSSYLSALFSPFAMPNSPLFLINSCTVCTMKIRGGKMLIKDRHSALKRHNFQLCGAGLPYADFYKYLGHIISSDLSDNDDIMRQTRCLNARANTIIRKFNCASLNTKLMLFRAYRMPIYGCQLWCSMS